MDADELFNSLKRSQGVQEPSVAPSISPAPKVKTPARVPEIDADALFQSLKANSPNSYEDQLPTLQPPTPTPGFFQRIKNAVQGTRDETVQNLQERGQQFSDIQQRQKEGKQGVVRSLYQTTTQPLLGGLQDVIGGTATAAARVAKAALPGANSVPKGEKTVVGEFVMSIKERPGLEDDIKVLQNTVERWEKLKQEDPGKAADIEGAANLALTFLDVLGLPPAIKAAEDVTAKGLLKQGKEVVSNIATKSTSKVKGGVEAVKTAIAKPSPKQLVIDAISPTLTKGEMERALKSGTVRNITSKTGAVTTDFSPDPRLNEIADLIGDVVDPKKTASQNLNKVRDQITLNSEYKVRPFLEENPVPFNFEDLRGSFDLVNPGPNLKIQPGAMEAYQNVKEQVLSVINTRLKKFAERGAVTDVNQLWDARKAVDNVIEEQLGAATFDSPQYVGIKAAARDYRKAYTDFIENLLAYPGQAENVNRMSEFLQSARARGIDIPNESEAIKVLQKQFGVKNTNLDAARAAFFKDEMKKLNAMYEALDNLSSKAVKEQKRTNFLKTPVGEKVKGAAAVVGAGAGLIGGYELLTD
jgi:hypothetical protein